MEQFTAIRDIQSVATFKRHLKTYLFDIAYIARPIL
jgi:hypothetical protein